MGTQVILDLIGSFIIGGMLLVQIANINANAQTQAEYYSQSRIAQRNLVTVVDILETDMRKLGYGVVDPTAAIIYADSNKLVFKSDYDKNGKIDTLSWYVGPVSELSSTPNPNDRVLYRVINKGTPKKNNLGVTRFSLKYYDQDMNPVTVVQAIKIIEITLAVQSVYPVNGEYPSAYWKQTRIATRNLNR